MSAKKEDIEYLQQRVEKIYDEARHKACPVQRNAAISYLKLAARRFKEWTLERDSDIAVMYSASLEAIQREIDNADNKIIVSNVQVSTRKRQRLSAALRKGTFCRKGLHNRCVKPRSRVHG
ncbi:MAG: hypothetical protein K6G15_00955 [Desulfovibrio sp.]|nr:hypothetical protein [Desulfovibrio sp.]